MHLHEDFLEGTLQVLVRHSDDAYDDHEKLHHLGGDDHAELRIYDVCRLNLPRQVSRPNIGRFHNNIEVSMSESGVLTIRGGKPHTPPQYSSTGNSSTEWFDILVGFELKRRRLMIAREACQRAGQNSAPLTHSLDVKIPFCVVDGIADRLRSYFDTSDRAPGW